MEIKNKKYLRNIYFDNFIIDNPKLALLIDEYDREKIIIIVTLLINHIIDLMDNPNYIERETVINNILVELEKINYPIYKTYYLFSTIRYLFKYYVVDNIDDVDEKLYFLKSFDDTNFLIDYNSIISTYKTIENERENKLEMYKRIVEHMAESVWI
jgi:hypothetical protein